MRKWLSRDFATKNSVPVITAIIIAVPRSGCASTQRADARDHEQERRDAHLEVAHGLALGREPRRHVEQHRELRELARLHR